MQDDPAIIEELTAYLDGELDAAAAQRVEQRLNSDSDYRAEMQSLQKTWELFDQLPAGQANASFTQSTMEMMVDEAVKLVHKKKRKWWIWPARLVILTAIPLLLAGASFQLIRQIQQQPNRQLVNNLLLIENFDHYLKVDRNLDFLVQLDERGLFAEENEFYAQGSGVLSADLFVDAEPGIFPSRETIENREQRIDALDIEQKNVLRRKYTEFNKLSSAQTEQLQKFHEELANHPQRERLTRAMNKYYDWLKTLGLTKQARLLDLQVDRRLAEIANIKTRQAREAFGREGSTKLPTARDAEFLFDWYEIAISSKESQIRSSFAEIVANYLKRNHRSIPRNQLVQFARRKPLNQLVAILIRIDREMIETLVLEDIDLLRRGLSFEARAIFDEQSPEGQNALVLNWIDSANQSKSTVSAEELQVFYEQLSVEERDELDKMAPENWIRTLTAKYRARYRYREKLPILNGANDWQSFFDNNGFGEF
jgi:hypothetical protein